MLLFLTSLEDPYTAIDGVGSAVAGSELSFYQSGTVTPQPVYSDSALETEIPQPITADESGEFSTIYVDPDLTYRSVLKTATGRLVFDVDPYEIDDSTTGRNAFRGPLVQALVDGVPVPGATMTFYTTQTSVKRDTFADGLLETPHPNPIQANAAGYFPPIYMSGVYRVVPSWTDEIDPYPPAAPEVVEVSVTIEDLGGGDAYGFEDPYGGSIDPTALTESIDITGLYFTGDDFVVKLDGELPENFLSIIVETTAGDVVLDAQNPDDSDENDGIYTYTWENQESEWDEADQDTTKDVTFSTEAP